MNPKDIKQIVELMKSNDLSYFHLEQDDFNIKLKKGPDAESIASLMAAMPQYAPAAPVAAPAAPAAAAAPAPVVAAATSAAPAANSITSPMVGTFYRKPSPEDPNFVEVGDTISEGQTICIIEAMKVMNEIKAEKGGKVTAIVASDSSPIQFGDTLFTLE